MRIHVIGFLKDNRHKRLTLRVWFYCVLYRFLIRFIPMKYIRRHMGEEGLETPFEADGEAYRYARLAARHVARSASRTPWESGAW